MSLINALGKALTLNNGVMGGMTNASNAAANVLADRERRRQSLADIADQNAEALERLQMQLNHQTQLQMQQQDFDLAHQKSAQEYDAAKQDDAQDFQGKQRNADRDVQYQQLRDNYDLRSLELNDTKNYRDASLKLQQNELDFKKMLGGYGKDGKPLAIGKLPIEVRTKMVGSRIDSLLKLQADLTKELNDPNTNVDAMKALQDQLALVQGGLNKWNKAYGDLVSGKDLTEQDLDAIDDSPGPAPAGAGQFDPHGIYGKFTDAPADSNAQLQGVGELLGPSQQEADSQLAENFMREAQQVMERFQNDKTGMRRLQQQLYGWPRANYYPSEAEMLDFIMRNPRRAQDLVYNGRGGVTGSY